MTFTISLETLIAFFLGSLFGILLCVCFLLALT